VGWHAGITDAGVPVRRSRQQALDGARLVMDSVGEPDPDQLLVGFVILPQV